MSASKFDIIIRDAFLVSAEKTERGDLGISDGKISAIGQNLGGRAPHEIEGTDLFALPGYIDAHVHLNEPGRESWEGFESGTAALLAGGCTCFIDMPLNSTPVLDVESFSAKAARLRKNSHLDGGLWGGLVPGNLEKLAELAAAGVVGFKAFMSNSGMADFPHSDRATLLEGMRRAAALHLPVAVHAESDEMTSRLVEEIRASGGRSIRDYLNSRPIEAELEAIGIALDLAKLTGCTLHVVHVSSAAGLELIDDARHKGVDVTAETCPHYLLLDEDDLFRLGSVAKCAPPLRPAAEKEKLWNALKTGKVQTVGSDHSPSPPELKTSRDFFEVWGGIAGCQHNYPLFFEEAVLRRKIEPSLVARLTALQVAERFRLAHKGDLRIGWDADITLLGNGPAREITPVDLLTKHPISAYIGRSTQTRVVTTIVRGQIAYGPGNTTPRDPARILRPTPL